MKLSALITKLLEFRKQHGDMPVVGRGFDESDYDPINGIDNVPIRLRVCSCPAHQENEFTVRHHGAYIEENDAVTPHKVFLACFIDANFQE